MSYDRLHLEVISSAITNMCPGSIQNKRVCLCNLTNLHTHWPRFIGSIPNPVPIPWIFRWLESKHVVWGATILDTEIGINWSVGSYGIPKGASNLAVLGTYNRICNATRNHLMSIASLQHAMLEWVMICRVADSEGCRTKNVFFGGG